MTDVALISSPTPSPLSALASRHAGTPPLGLAYIAAALCQAGYSVDIADMNLCRSTRRFLQRFLSIKRPRMVGISSLTESFPNAVRIAQMAKEICADVIVVVGGPHVTFAAEEALQSGPFDFVVCGEGETTMVELTRCLLDREGACQEILGLFGRQEERIWKTPPRPPRESLDDIPLPARHLLPMDEYPNAGAIITGRGCPNRCIFCTAGAMFGGRYRQRSPEQVATEIGSVRAMGIGSLMFLDDTLTADLERLDRILFLMEEQGPTLSWVCESRVDIEDPGFFQRMARAGCIGVQFGVESGSAEVLGKLGKGIDLEQVVQAVQGAAQAGINPVCSLIIGLPDDTAETIDQTIDFAVDLQKEFYAQVGIAIATPFPGTYLYRHAGQLGLEIEEQDYSQYNLYTPVMRTRHLSRQEIRNFHFESLHRLRRHAPRGMQNLFPLNCGPKQAVYDDRDDYV